MYNIVIKFTVRRKQVDNMEVKEKILSILDINIEVLSGLQPYKITNNGIRNLSFWKIVVPIIHMIIYIEYVIFIHSYLNEVGYKQSSFILTHTLYSYIVFLLITLMISYVFGFLNSKSFCQLSDKISKMNQDLTNFKQKLSVKLVSNDSHYQTVIILILLFNRLLEFLVNLANFRTLLDFLRMWWIMYRSCIPTTICICIQYSATKWIISLQTKYEIVNKLLSKYLISNKENFRQDIMKFTKISQTIINIFKHANDLLSLHFLITMSQNYINLIGNIYLIWCHFLFDGDSILSGFYLIASNNCITCIILLWLMSKQAQNLKLEVSTLIYSRFY